MVFNGKGVVFRCQNYSIWGYRSVTYNTKLAAPDIHVKKQDHNIIMKLHSYYSYYYLLSSCPLFHKLLQGGIKLCDGEVMVAVMTPL